MGFHLLSRADMTIGRYIFDGIVLASVYTVLFLLLRVEVKKCRPVRYMRTRGADRRQ